MFNYITDKVKTGIIFLQETHSIEENIKTWKSEWKGDLYCNHGSSNSRGTLIGFTDKLSYQILKYEFDDDGRLQIMSIKCNDKKYLLVNIYNENVEQNQVILIKKLDDKLTNFDNLLDHEIILGGDWNFIFNRRLDAEGGNPTLKMNSIAEIRKIMAKYELTDIFRIRYPERSCFTFRQENSKLLRRLDYFLVSNTLQETVLNTEVLASLASDHSPVLISFKVGEECKSESGY